MAVGPEASLIEGGEADGVGDGGGEVVQQQGRGLALQAEVRSERVVGKYLNLSRET